MVRRTGFLLETAGIGRATRALARKLRGGNLEPQPLDPGLPKGGSERDDRWALYVNTTVEPEPS